MTKRMTTTIVAACMLACLLVSNVAAVPVSTVNHVVLDTATASVTAGNPRGMIAYYQPRNLYGTLTVDGDAPGVFQRVNWDGTPDGLASTRDEGEEYPFSFGRVGAVGGQVEDPWDVQWYDTRNVSGPVPANTTLEYDYALSAYLLESMGAGAKKDYHVTIIANLRWYCLPLDIASPGLHILFYSPEANVPAGQRRLVSPDFVDLPLTPGALPARSAGGLPIARFVAFIADGPGTYQFYFTTDTYLMNFELQRYGATRNVKAGDLVDFKENDKPCTSTMLECSQMLVHVYEIDVEAYTPMVYNFRITSAPAPLAFVAMPGPWGYVTQAGLVNAPQNQPLVSSFSGKAYVVVIHNQYFQWVFGGLPSRVSLAYRLSLGSIPVTSHVLGSTTSVPVDPAIGWSWIRVNSTGQQGWMFNATATTGEPVFNDGINAPDVMLRHDATNGYTWQASIMNAGGWYLHDLSNGIYDISVRSSYTVDMVEYLKIQSTGVEGSTLPFKSLSFADPTTRQNESAISSHAYLANTTVANGVLLPSVNRFTYQDSFASSFNVSLFRDENPDLFEWETPDMQVWTWSGNEDEYIEVSGLAGAVPLFVNGSALTHPVYFGSTQKFDRLRLDLATFAGTSNYTWEFRGVNDGTWHPLQVTGGWSDTTEVNNLTLGMNGTITFNPVDIPGWTLDDDVDPSGGTFDMNATARLWWIRLRGTEASPASIPSLAAGAGKVNAYRYIDLHLTVTGTVALTSRFDGTTPVVPAGIAANANLNINGNATSVSQAGLWMLVLMGAGSGMFGAWPVEARVRDFNASQAGTWVPMNRTVNLHVCRYDARGFFVTMNHGPVGLPTVNDLATLNWSTYQDYEHSVSFNGTEYMGILCKVDGNQLYDWYQFIASTNNSNSALNWMMLLFDNPWTGNAVPAMNGLLPIVGNVVNMTAERGVAVSSFWLVILTNPVDVTRPVVVHFTCAALGVDVLKVQRSVMETLFGSVTPSPAFGFIGEPWFLAVAIGGSAAAAVLIVIAVKAKKDPVFALKLKSAFRK